MAGISLPLTDLKAGRSGQKVIVRLLRHWEARNVKKEGALMGVDMLLLDEHENLMHGTINVQRLAAFQPLLHEGRIYVLGDFEIVRSNSHFRLCESDRAIRFTEKTTLVEVAENLHSIPIEKFTFRTHDELVALANTNTELPDIIGVVKNIKAVLSENHQRAQRIMAHISLNGKIACLSAFDNLATVLHNKLQGLKQDPSVILATNVNPKFVGGKLFLNATSGTHFFFDKDIETTKTFITEHGLVVVEGGASPAETKYNNEQKIELLTIGELNDYILKSAPQDIEFLCKSKIIDIETRKGWRYIGCSKCSSKLQRGNSSFTCNTCHAPAPVGIMRYRVGLAVSDGVDNAFFTAFDTDMTKLTKVRASDVDDGSDLAESAMEGTEAKEIPQFIKDLVGQTFTFQLKLTDYNFSPKHHAFTISRVFDASDVVPQPSFVIEEPENHGCTTSTPSKEASVVAQPSGYAGRKTKKTRVL